MYQLFQESPLQPGGELVIPDYRRIQTGLRFSVKKVIDFRRLNPQGLNGSHFLVRLLQSVNIPLSMDADIYNDKVSDMALNLAMSLKMTSPLSKGQIFTPGVFYGQHVTEVLMANADPYDVSRMEKEWQDMRPIRVLYHPQTDLQLNIPDGRFDSEEAGMAVISINIPMLASQYRRWREVENMKDIWADSPKSIMQFLMAYPIPNILHSHVDVAMMNRLIGRYFDVEMSKTRSRNSFALTDWTDEVDRTIDHYLRLVSTRRWDFDTLVSHMPVVSHEDLHDVLRLPKMPFSQQVQWAVVLARLALVTFLVQFNRRTENPRNQPYLNYLRRYLRQMDLNRSMRNALPTNRYEDVMFLIDEGITPYL